MLNNIKISQTTNEIILNVNVIADINEILEELQERLPKLRDFYQTSTIPMRVTGRLFTESEINRVKAEIQSEIEDKLSEEMLEGKIKAGEKYTCRYNEDSFVFASE